MRILLLSRQSAHGPASLKGVAECNMRNCTALLCSYHCVMMAHMLAVPLAWLTMLHTRESCVAPSTLRNAQQRAHLKGKSSM